jgi:hypothetical protein
MPAKVLTWVTHSTRSWQVTQTKQTQVSTASLAFVEAELAVVPGAELVVAKDAKTGLEVPRAAAHKSRVVIGSAQQPATPIA